MGAFKKMANETNNEDYGKVIPLDILVHRCGYFNDSCERPYGCDHPDQEETDDETEKGKCYGFSCPIACELNPQSEPEDRKEFGNDWKSMSDGHWVKVYGNYKENNNPFVSKSHNNLQTKPSEVKPNSSQQ